MGQRLNIEIVKNRKTLANSYYHWSGYSSSAIEMVTSIIKNFNYIKKYKVENVKDKDLLLAIRLLEITDAGMREDTINEAIKKVGLVDENINFKKCNGRNYGIIEVEEKGMKENRYWEEGRVTIDIENEDINFRVFNYITEEEVKEYYIEDNFEDINIDFEHIKFEEIFNIKAFIDKACYNSQYYFKNKFDNKYIGLIE